ncbi:MAG: ribonuclease HI [Salinispira sp.]
MITIYTDGGCTGNPGPGAWAFVAADGSADRLELLYEQSGYVPDTTNNRMELKAVIEALRWIQKSHPHIPAVIHTDSQYTQKGIGEWIKNWKRNNWKTAAKKPVKNKDLWIELNRLNTDVQPQWKWVKGHAGVELNEHCDDMVKKCLKNENI